MDLFFRAFRWFGSARVAATAGRRLKIKQHLPHGERIRMIDALVDGRHADDRFSYERGAAPLEVIGPRVFARIWPG